MIAFIREFVAQIIDHMGNVTIRISESVYLPPFYIQSLLPYKKHN